MMGLLYKRAKENTFFADLIPLDLQSRGKRAPALVLSNEGLVLKSEAMKGLEIKKKVFSEATHWQLLALSAEKKMKIEICPQNNLNCRD